MNEQPTFADLDYQHKRRRTRREEFLERMDSLIPWQRLEDRIGPHYFRAERGRRPYLLAVMLRVHIVQLCYNLSDPAMEDLLYEAESVRRFAGLRLSEPIPDESAILHFRHLLERHELGQGLFEEIKSHLEEQGVRLREGTIVDATIIEAPSSTKNRAGQRDPEMRQVKKGNQYHFGMKLHIGVDAETGLVHSLSTTSANVHDVTEAHRLLHGEEQQVWGDAGYIGVQKRKENLELAVGLAGGHEAGPATETGSGKHCGPGGEGQGIDTGQGGTPFPGREAAILLRQGTLPGPSQEHGPVGAAAGAGQPETRPGPSGRLTQGAVRPIVPHHPKSESGKARETTNEEKTAGRKPPHKPAQVKDIHCSQLFRGFLALF